MSGRRLEAALGSFSADLGGFAQRTADAVASLRRIVEQRPAAGVRDFKECLEDFEVQVADFSDELQALEGLTGETASFEELIGHCSALYTANRDATLALEEHLEQYGYVTQNNDTREPEDPCAAIEPPHRVHDVAAPASPRSADLDPHSSSMALQAPGTAARFRDSAAPTGMQQLTDTAEPSTVGHHAGRTSAYPAGSVARPRPSIASDGGSTPGALFISPGVAALASKYATSSAGGSSLGGTFTAPRSSMAPAGTGAGVSCTSGGSAVRDLHLCYPPHSGGAAVCSPDLPIFGRTLPAAEQQLEQQQQQHQHELQQQPQAADRGCSGGGGEESTGELYGSIIRSSLYMSAPAASDGTGGASEPVEHGRVVEPATPPSPRAVVNAGNTSLSSVPCSPRAPGTAGRLPPDWHDTRMRELEDLAADVTLTLSTMKRTPSRSKLALLAADNEPGGGGGGGSGGSSDGGSGSGNSNGAVWRVQRRVHTPRATDETPPPIAAAAAAAADSIPAAAAAAAVTTPPAVAPAAAAPVIVTTLPATAVPAAVVTADDLEGVMAGLSLKYAAVPAAAAAAAGGSPPVSASSSGAWGVMSPPPSTVGGTPEEGGMAVMQHHVPPTAAAAAAADTAKAAYCSDYGVGGLGTALGGAANTNTAAGAAASAVTTTTPPSPTTIRTSAPGGDGGGEVMRVQQQPQQQQGGWSLPSGCVAAVSSASGDDVALSLRSMRGRGAQEVVLPAAAAEEAQVIMCDDTGAGGSGGGRELTPRAERAARRAQQQQQQQQTHRPRAQESSLSQHQAQYGVDCGASGGDSTVLRSVGNQLAGAGVSTNSSQSLAKSPTRAAPEPAPVTSDEYASLPSWCRGLVSLEQLNAALEELTSLAAGRVAGARGSGAAASPSSMGGFSADDLELLGHSGSRAKTIVSCLHRLRRAALQRSASTGANVYTLLPARAVAGLAM